MGQEWGLSWFQKDPLLSMGLHGSCGDQGQGLEGVSPLAWHGRWMCPSVEVWLGPVNLDAQYTWSRVSSLCGRTAGHQLSWQCPQSQGRPGSSCSFDK